jgi:SAM-dependent MidA family methyltransferase
MEQRPVRLDAFMARANAAYYAQKNPFADFTTAPEISQVFGELLGAWAAVVWQHMGAPDPVFLVEAGPGRGTLMADALRAVSRVAPAFGRAAKVHFVETSQRLRAEQAARVPNATWHDALEKIPPGPAIFLANEFLDALPIRQFVRTATGWHERFVAGERFVEFCAHGPGMDASPGDVVEQGEAAADWTQSLAQRLVAQGGAALILDYGTEETRAGDSFQALRDAKPADPLADPGTADLTAHVDFAAIARVAREAGAAVWGPVAQGVFLGRLGLWERAKILAGKHPERAEEFFAAATRLAAPSRMGALFKAMCITAPGCMTPPGFES